MHVCVCNGAHVLLINTYVVHVTPPRLQQKNNNNN